MFGYINNNGTVKNLQLANISVTNTDPSHNAGGVVAMIDGGGTVENCAVSGSVTSANTAGGIAAVSLPAQFKTVTQPRTLSVQASPVAVV